MGEITTTYRILVRKLVGTLRSGWEDTISMDFREIRVGFEDSNRIMEVNSTFIENCLKVESGSGFE